FDFRTDTILHFFGTLRYLKSHNQTRYSPDAWLYPDETLAQGGGDCEDLAFLLAALLMTAGVSNYCLRVALGSVRIHQPRGQTRKHDHCWVMYLNESGVWEILEPTIIAEQRPRAKARKSIATQAYPSEYIPHYVFNADHLWSVRSAHFDSRLGFQDYCVQRRNFWNRFDPRFATKVHATIFDTALGDRVSAPALSAIKRKSLWLDVNIAAYDPRDHFDNGYIDD